jgi:transposase
MARKPHISQELAQCAKNAVRTANDVHELRKAQAILLPAVFSLDLFATGMAIGRSKASVCRLQAEFRSDCTGARSAKKKRGGRRHQNMSPDQEAQFLEPFFKKAREGQPLAVAEIRDAYEAAIGKKVPASTVYRLLARHGWSPPFATHSSTDQE